MVEKQFSQKTQILCVCLMQKAHSTTSNTYEICTRNSTNVIKYCKTQQKGAFKIPVQDLGDTHLEDRSFSWALEQFLTGLVLVSVKIYTLNSKETLGYPQQSPPQ